MYKTNEKGYIYLEALVSVVMLGITAICFSVTLIQTNYANQRAIQISEATRLAKATIESLKQNEGTKDRTSSDWIINNTVTSANHIQYRITTSLIDSAKWPKKPVDIQSNPNIVPLQVTIRWNYVHSNRSTPMQVSLSTIFM